MSDKMFFAVIMMLGFIGIGMMHEQVHVAVYRSYGIDSHVEYFSHFPTIVTIADEGCPTEACIFTNNLNEIIGYPLNILYMVVGIWKILRLE